MRLWEFKDLNKNKGFHFFDDSSMRFFKSRILDFDIITGLMITSEKNLGCDRAYTVRKCDFTSGDVTQVSEFQAFSSIGRARTYFKNVLRGKV